MSTTPLRKDILEDGIRPRNWHPRKSNYKIPLRVLRLCLLGMFLPSVLVAGPLYLRYRVYSEQLYPLTMSDQRLIDAKVSTTWCQSQIVKVNTTFNAYLMSSEPVVRKETVPVSMTRHLVMEDDMKEYWGFYLLSGSSVTVSTCVRWPGASLTIIRGHKNLHECAFIGDDSSEELEELLEVAKEQGFLDTKGTTESQIVKVNTTFNAYLMSSEPVVRKKTVPFSMTRHLVMKEDMKQYWGFKKKAARLRNEPAKMGRVSQDVHFHHEGSVFRLNASRSFGHQPGSHELDAQAMRNILTQLFAKTVDTKKKQKENQHHHYEAVFREATNIDKPPTTKYSGDTQDQFFHPINRFNDADISENSTEDAPLSLNTTSSPEEKQRKKEALAIQQNSTHSLNIRPTKSNAQTETETKHKITKEQKESEAEQVNSAEMFQDVLRKINSLGDRGKEMLHKLMNEIDARDNAEGAALKRLVNQTMNDKTLSSEAKRRRKRDIVLSSPLHRQLTEEDEDGDAPLEEGMLHPDGIAEDRGTVNETTLNDRSNSEFWSSFSSSEERLLECKGLILNLPLTPHRHCTPKHENQHSAASFANTVTYRVPVNGYYFFVFNSENEIQPNYVRVKFDLLKTVYNTSNSVHACRNSTKECSLPFTIFSNERTVLELPLSGNDSQWNEEYIVVSTCEPRTTVYIICVIMVPLLILCFAFH